MGFSTASLAEKIMNKTILKYLEKTLWVILLIGLIIYYPGKLIYSFSVSYLGVFVAKLEMFEGISGIKELLIIEGISALVLSSISVLCAWLLFKKHKKAKTLIFIFLLLTLINYLLEPVWFRIAGFPIEIFEGRLYEKPIDLLRPVGAAFVFVRNFLIASNINKTANK